MTWAAPLQPPHIQAYIADTYELDARQHGAYVLLTMRYLLGGPLPYDEKRLSDIARVTLRVWRTRVWPVLQEFFTPGDDGLVHHEELDRLAQVTPTDSRRRAAARKAARKRWDDEAARKAARTAGGAESDASPMRSHADAYADAYESHTQSDAISTLGADKTHADRMPDAFASLRAPPLSLASLASLQSEEESQRERESAPVSGDASGDASGMRSDAIASSSHRKNRRQAIEPGTRIPADWMPAPGDRQEARKRGLDPDKVAVEFRDYWLGKAGPDGMSADWAARFRRWVRQERLVPPPQQQGHLTMAVAGGSAPARAEAQEPLAAAWAARTADTSAPFPPTRERFMADCAAAGAAEAKRWVALAAARPKAPRPSDVRLPEYVRYMADPAAYEEDMAEAEAAFAPEQQWRASG